ncbi:hypothetical protein HAX54_029436, partial [Datura stramonium]|nr:hypothetical protein [Datura stramonium]
MSTSRECCKGKTPITDATTLGADSDEETQIGQVHFWINKMNNYYVKCKEHRSITVEARFEVDSFKEDFSDIY